MSTTFDTKIPNLITLKRSFFTSGLFLFIQSGPKVARGLFSDIRGNLKRSELNLQIDFKRSRHFRELF